MRIMERVYLNKENKCLTSKNKKIIIFDIGSQKIGAISFKIINNKPIIFDMEYQKNNIDNSQPNFLSNNIKKFIKKFQIKREAYNLL